MITDINRALPDLEVRVWPSRFTNGSGDNASSISDYHGCYLIGLSKAKITETLREGREKPIARHTVDQVLDRFLNQLKIDKNYDPATCWIGVSLAKAVEVQDLQLDSRDWGNYEMEADTDDEEDVDDTIDEADIGPIQRTIAQRPKPTSTPVSASKLRPASDVLNRLRWDPSLDPSDYIIGYEDRFLGVRETGLEKWRTEQTDEEFIPQHRILYFRKKDTDIKGQLVWERATRIDRVFGSGAGAGGSGA